MNLALDFGNTRIKAGLFGNGRLERLENFSTPAELLASDIFRGCSHMIICSVTGFHLPVIEALKDQKNILLFKPDTPVPLENRYKSALTLGSDRLAAAVGGFFLYPHRNVLSVDAGTCIKYNFVNAKDEYLGGAISPGLEMRLKAMNHFTQRLPLVDLAEHSELIGNNTASSMLAGSVIAAACEIDGMISRYRGIGTDLQVVLTGGDAPYLSGQLKNSFFAHQNLVLLGLNTILEFNLEK